MLLEPTYAGRRRYPVWGTFIRNEWARAEMHAITQQIKSLQHEQKLSWSNQRLLDGIGYMWLMNSVCLASDDEVSEV